MMLARIMQYIQSHSFKLSLFNSLTLTVIRSEIVRE